MSSLLVAGCGACLGIGLVLMIAAWFPGEASEKGSIRASQLVREARRALPSSLLGVAVGFVAWTVTDWPVAIPIGWLAVFGLPKLFRQTSGSVSIRKIEAIAVWTEMLQATMAASAGLVQAIMATAPLAPPAIRAATSKLAGRLSAGMHPEDALVRLADELDDPCADRVVCALLLATSSRAQRLGDLLAMLADSTREEVAVRLRIETSRASVRSGVRTVLVFSVGFAVVLTIVAHAYLAPFAQATGQVVLAAVAALYGMGLTLLVHLSRPPDPVRLIGREVTGR